MIFTQEQIKEIEKRLYTKRIKDSQFPEASRLDGSEFFVIVQDGANRKISLSNMWDYLLKSLVEKSVEENSKEVAELLGKIAYFGRPDVDPDTTNK